MLVLKRNGSQVPLRFAIIKRRIENLCYCLNENFIDPDLIMMQVENNVYNFITTVEINQLVAETAVKMAVKHPDYAILAARFLVSNLHEETKNKFSDVIEDLYNNHDPSKRCEPIISKSTRDIVVKNADVLERSFLAKINNKVVERPQYMLMRLALSIHGEDINSAIETYNLMSEKWFMHATSTLLDAGRTSVGCGIGLSVHYVTADGSKIFGFVKGEKFEPAPCVFNSIALQNYQGGLRVRGTFATYTELWHAHVTDVLDHTTQYGENETIASGLYQALWVPDLFMKRVEADANWTLMCSYACPELNDLWGDEFEELYEEYESEGRGCETIKARSLWAAIIQSQIKSGAPYILYKDSANRKLNQQNLGSIKCSSLCAQISKYSNHNEFAVSSFSSISLTHYVKADGTFDFERLIDITSVVTRNLNLIIDKNYYRLKKCNESNMRYRPISIGVQGLADTFILMRYPFESEEAQKLNREIFEAIYYGALKESCELAKINGPYERYEGSTISKGILQFDMWNVKPSSNYDFDSLREEIKKYGVRNSLIITAMPTLSIAQILGNNESFEPYKSNLISRFTSFDNINVVNPYLIKHLIKCGIWSDELRQEIITHNGSIQKIDCIPDDLKKLYKTSWEIPYECIINMAVDRTPYIDQSQSLNIHMAEPTYDKMSSMYFYAWKKGF